MHFEVFAHFDRRKDSDCALQYVVGVDVYYRYLASGLFAGVGEVTAKNIVDLYGTATLDVIENAPNRRKDSDCALQYVVGVDVYYAIAVVYVAKYNIFNVPFHCLVLRIKITHCFS